MANATGCLKYSLFGCLGILVVVILFVGVTALVAWNRLDNQQIEDRVLAPIAEIAEIAEQDQPSGTPALTPTGAGRLVLDFAQGEFQIHRAEAGEGLSIKARYDAEVYRLEERYENLPDSSWVYQVRFFRTISGLQALFRQLMGGGYDSVVHVYIPPDIPIELEIRLEEGGFEAELGGLWITAADIRCSKGGFSLSVDEPLVEPMERLSFRSRMGGFEAVRLGNASPRFLDIDCTMGGADVDLRGEWVQDCNVTLTVKMGGMDIRVPDDVEIQGVADDGHGLRHADVEIQRPVLTFEIKEKMGGIEVR
jgi:hypothetical protein